MNIAKAEKPSRINFALRVLDGFARLCCRVIKRAQTDRPLAPSIYDDVLRNRERERLTQRGFADLKTQELSVYIPTLKNGGLLRNILPCQRGHLGRRKALIYATCRERKQNK